MTPPPTRCVRALSFHAAYRCRHRGACCSSGWDIPVEPEMHLRNALASGRLRIPEATIASALPGALIGHGRSCFRRVSGLPHGARVVFATDSSGRCIFLDADRHCAIHRQLGRDALPSACRDFPRVVTLTPLGVSVTLSHYCPTAADLLFTPVVPRDDRLPGPEVSAVRILENPPGFPASWPYEGLDARVALPPLLRPGVLMDWPSLECWERFAFSVLAGDARSPEVALDVLASAAEEARRWTPEDGPFAGFFERVLSSQDDSSGPARPESCGVAWRLAAGCVPHRAQLLPLPGGLGDADTGWVAPAWAAFGLPVRRWLASKAFASWLTLQGEGLRTTVLGLRVALGVLRAEAARGCAEAGRALDAALLREAVRRADLLLVHLADPEVFARRLSRGESSGDPAATW